MLSKQPDIIYLKFENAKWKIHADLEKGVYPMKATGKIWKVSEATNIKARRTGFQIVPDFGQTAHSMQGASLASVIVDCLPLDHCPKATDMLAAYIGLSRVRTKEALLIAEAFSPALFVQGQPPGPDILMKVMRREITADDSQQDSCCSSLSLCPPHCEVRCMCVVCCIEFSKQTIRTIAGNGGAHQEAARRGRGEELQKNAVGLLMLQA